MAGTVDEVAPAVLARHGVGPLARRPIVLAGVSGSSWGESVIRRAAVLAAEGDADLLVVHVNVSDGLVRRPAEALDRYRAMASELGGPLRRAGWRQRGRHTRRGGSWGTRTRVVVARHRSGFGGFVHGSVASRIRRLAPGLTVDEVRPG